MDSENIARRQGELNKIKKGLKDWEHGFFKSHKRKPTIKDIQERPKVERVYKDYHAKKKQLRLMSEECGDSQSLSQPISFNSQQQQPDPASQETKINSPSLSSNSQSPSQKRRRGSHASVEYIRSPSHRLSRIKYVENLELPTTSLDFGSSSKASSETTTTTTRSSSRSNGVSDADAFWLTGSQDASRVTRSSHTTTPEQENGTSLSDASTKPGNTPSSFLLADTTSTTKGSTITKKKKKKNAALEQKLFGHLIWKPRDTLSPALKAERDSSSQPTTPTTDTAMPLDDSQSVSSTINSTSTDTMQGEGDATNMVTDTTGSSFSGKTVNDLKIDGLIIAEHEHDPFRHFDPDLVSPIGDPDYFVMPGLFASARARSTIMAPMMDDDNGRHKRILEALRKGTLGEKRRDDDDMDDMDEGLKRFLDENTDTFADPTEPTEQEESRPTYRKKFTQKRQTRLHKFKYVETTPSDL